MKIISMMLIVTMFLQTVGCSTIRPLKTLNPTEIKPEELKKKVSVRILLKQKSDVPFEERRFTCKIVSVNRDYVVVRSVNVRRFKTRTTFRIMISDIQEIEILEREIQWAKSAAIVGVGVSILLIIDAIVGEVGEEGPGIGISLP